MRNLAHVLLIGSALLHSVLAIAQDDGGRAGSANRAVNITLGNTGGGLDDAALRSVRKLVGKAITANTVDTFAVYSPRVGGPIPIEGGLSACAEAGFNASPQKFNAFVSQLRSIHPRPGTFLNVELTERCKPADSTRSFELWRNRRNNLSWGATILRIWNRSMQDGGRARRMQDQTNHLSPDIQARLRL